MKVRIKRLRRLAEDMGYDPSEFTKARNAAGLQDPQALKEHIALRAEAYLATDAYAAQDPTPDMSPSEFGLRFAVSELIETEPATA